MNITFNTHGNEKQKDCARYWSDSTTTNIVYGGSKGCQYSLTKVQTKTGYKEIRNITTSDFVLTINEITKDLEYKKVLEVKKYFAKAPTEYHKLITFVMRDGTKTSLTPNHEFYFKGNWIASGEFAERVLGIHSRDRYEIHDIHSFESAELWTDKTKYYKAFFDVQELLKDFVNDDLEKEKNFSDTPISCYRFYPKSVIEANDKSYRLRQAEQPLFKLGMGNCKRKCISFKRKMSAIIWKQKRIKKQQHDIDSRTSFRYSCKIQKKNSDKGNVRKGVWSFTSDNKRCYIAKELDASLIKEVRFELIKGYVYDLHVQDNHNYCITENNIIVHNSAKSFTGCSLVFADALMYPNTRYFIARKKLTDLRKHTIPSIHEVFEKWGLDFDDYCKFNGQDNTFVLKNGSTVLFLDAKWIPSDPNYHRFGSMQMTKGWIEEAGEFEAECTRNLAISVGRWKNDIYNVTGKVLETCNPAKNYLYKDYYLPSREGTLEERKKFIQALPTDNKMLPDGYLEHLENTLSPNEKQRLLYGNWEYDDNPDALFDYEDILGMYTNSFVEEGKERYITADIAYMGSDKFVICVWYGFVLKHIHSIDKIDESMISKKIHEIRMKHKVPIKNVIYDADGLKMFVRQSAKTGHLAGATQFHNGSKPLKIKGQVENFSNLKTQCAFKLAELVRNNEIFVETTDYRKQVVEEFQQICKLPITDDGKISLEKKDDVRKRLGRSYDYWDNFNMRVYVEINKSVFKDKSWVTAF